MKELKKSIVKAVAMAIVSLVAILDAMRLAWAADVEVALAQLLLIVSVPFWSVCVLPAGVSIETTGIGTIREVRSCISKLWTAMLIQACLSLVASIVVAVGMVVLWLHDVDTIVIGVVSLLLVLSMSMSTLFEGAAQCANCVHDCDEWLDAVKRRPARCSYVHIVGERSMRLIFDKGGENSD